MALDRLRVRLILLTATVIVASVLTMVRPAPSLGAFPGTNGNIHVGLWEWGQGNTRSDRWDPVTGSTTGTALDQGKLGNISASADGSQLIGQFAGGTATGAPSGLYRTGARSSDMWRVNGASAGAFLPDGRVLYVTGSQLRVVNQDGSGDSAMAGISIETNRFVVAPDGAAIYYAGTSGSMDVVWRQPLDGSARTTVSTRPAKPYGTPTPFTWVQSTYVEDVSPDGSKLLLLIESGADVMGGGRVPPGSLFTVPTAGGAATPVATAGGTRPTGRFSPDGTQIAYLTTNEYADAGSDGGDISLYVANLDGSAPRRLGGYPTTTQDGVSGMAWLPGPGFQLRVDGEQLVGDLVELDLSLTNRKDTPYRDLRYADSGHRPGLVFNTALYSPEYRASFTVAGGPTPSLLDILAPGALSEHQYLVAIDEPGNIQVRAEVTATDDRTGPIEAKDTTYVLARNRDWAEWEQMAAVAGGHTNVMREVQSSIDAVNQRAFGSVNTALKKSVPSSTWRIISKATPYERGLARTLGLPQDALAWLPNDPATARRAVSAFRAESTAAEGRVGKRALGSLYNRGVAIPWSYWSDYVQNNGINPIPVAAQTYEEGKYWAERGATTTKGYAVAAYKFASAPDKQHQFDEAAGPAILSMEAGLKRLGKVAPTQARQFAQLATDDPVKAAKMLGNIYGTARGEVALVAAETMFTPSKAGVARAVTNTGRSIERFGKVVSTAKVDRPLDLMSRVEKGAVSLPSVARLGMPEADVKRWSGVVAQLEAVAAKRGVDVDLSLSFRPRNYHSSLIGNGLGKNMFVKKIKAGDDIDLLLGMDPSGLGKAAVYKPKLPPNFAKLDASMQQQLKERAADMNAGFKEYYDRTSNVYKARTRAGGVTATSTLGGNDVTRIRMKLKGSNRNGTITIDYEELVVDGRTILKKGAKTRPMVSDYDGNSILQVNGKNLPPSVRGLIEIEAMRLQREAGVKGMAVSFHGWTKNAFDMPASAQRATFKFLLAGLPRADAEKLVAQYVDKYGPEARGLLGDALDKAGTDFVVRVTRNGAEAAQGF
jgi:hypothetical protein